MNAHVKFSDLGVDILLPVLEQVASESPESLRTFRLVSRYCNTVAEVYLYRVISWHQKPRNKKALTIRLVNRLVDKDDHLSKVVRGISVESFKVSSKQLNAELLEQVLMTIKDLQTLRWNATAHVPEFTLSCLETMWPQCRLSVNIGRRRWIEDGSGDADNRKLDVRLLSSPLLHSLSCVALVEERNMIKVSEFPALAQILKRSRNLRKLSLGAIQLNFPRPKYVDVYKDLPKQGFGPMNLGFVEGDSFPPLEELEIHSAIYEMSPAHCKVWRWCMNWERLQRLHLPVGCPQTLFEVLMDTLPNLKYLCFGFGTQLASRSSSGWTCADLNVVKKFLLSLRSLQELEIMNRDYMSPEPLLPTFVQLGETLRVLNLYGFPWKVATLRNLLPHYKKLESLSIDMPLEFIQREQGESGRPLWKLPQITPILPPNHADSPLHTLCFYLPLDVLPRWFLDLFVNTHQHPSSPDRPTLDKLLATTVAMKLFAAVFENEEKLVGEPRTGDGGEEVEKKLQLKFFYRTSFYWERWHSVVVRVVKGREGSEGGGVGEDEEVQSWRYQVDVEEGMQPLFEFQK